jgi:hypothetical protein
MANGTEWQSGVGMAGDIASFGTRNQLCGTALPREKIAGLAYLLFLDRGQAHGRDREDWYAAERELVFS